MTKIINGQSIPNMPWQDKPEGCVDPVWRYSENPVIKRDLLPFSNSIFNSAVVPFEGGFAGVFRVDNKSRDCRLHFGRSKDGLNWDIDHEFLPIKDYPNDEDGILRYGYDPRVCKIDDKYYITWCNGMPGGPTIGVGYTTDFKNFTQLENAFLPYNRNGVLFPRKINGKYVMFSRPSDKGHTPFGDIFCSLSPDLEYWGHHRLVMTPIKSWECKKIGAGPVPIETDEGWLLIYHGVLISCSGFVYSMGAALLDTDCPWKVKYRTNQYIMSPQMPYECVGDVPNVTFPCATLADADTGRIAIYYGAADTVTALAFTTVDELVEFTKKNSSI